MKTTVERNNEWRDGDRLIPPKEAAQVMNIPLDIFNIIDKGKRPADWPRCYELSSRIRRYSFMDAKDYARAHPTTERPDCKISDDDMAVLWLNPHLCDGDDYAYAEDICRRADTVDAEIGLDTLRCCVREGPIWEGNLPSKVQRDQLHQLGLIHPVVVKDEEGFWAANYTGRRVLTVVENRRAKR